MPRKGFTEEQIAFALRQAESGTPVGEVCRKLGVSEQSFYRWKKQFAGMGISEIRRLKAARGREHEAEAACRGPDAGQDHVVGCSAKNV